MFYRKDTNGIIVWDFESNENLDCIFCKKFIIVVWYIYIWDKNMIKKYVYEKSNAQKRPNFPII